MKTQAKNKFADSKKYFTELFATTDPGDLIGLNIPHIEIYYGLVDYKGDAVYPSETNIKEATSNPNVLALDFVIDAFEQFEKDIDYAIQSGRVKKDSFLNRVKPTKGWKSATEMYYQHMSKVYELFVGGYLRRTNNHAQIKNFNDFVNMFMDFAKENSNILPYTLTKFILSNYASKRISGFVIEVLDKSYNDKKYSIEKIFKDPSYELYKNLAIKNGFKIDLGVPWRLVADIRTSKMRYYMNRPSSDNQYLVYGISDVPTLFDTYFYKTYRKDVLFLKKYLISFYNHFVASLPFSKSVCPGRTKVTRNFIAREPLEERLADLIYHDIDWTMLYFKIRLLEDKLELSDPAIAAIRKKIIFINNRHPYEAVVTFIKEKLVELTFGKA